MRYSLFRLPLLLLVLYVSTAGATIIHVPGDESTIQGGIDACVDGDTVLVAPGTYYEHDIDFFGKAITVMGTDPWDLDVVGATIVDANNMGRVFTFHSREDSTSVLAGMTITGGYDNWFSGGGKGGGIYVESSSPKIMNNIITGNRVFTDYQAYGGGIYYDYLSTAFLTNNLIYGNEARASNVGMKIYAYGGGVYCNAISGNISNNRITGNHVHSYAGGGSYIAYAYGSGIYCGSYSSLVLINNTLTGNTISADAGYGGGVYGSPTIINTIVWGNDRSDLSGSPIVRFSNIEGGYSGEGNIDADPDFITFHGFDFLLRRNSPCIDTGAPMLEDGTSWPEWYSNGARSDMGAYGGPGNIGWLR